MGKRRPTIAYVGAAANDSRVFAAMIRTLVFGGSANVVTVALSRRATPTSTIRAELAAADLVFFTGGDVGRGMELIDGRDLAPYLRELATQGKAMEGISAGAILLGRHWVRFQGKDESRGAPFDCLGIVPASFDTHDEADGWQEAQILAGLLAGSDERIVYGIVSSGCARWCGGKLTALGRPLARFRCAASPVRMSDLAAETVRRP
jgi:hypothetical protein